MDDKLTPEERAVVLAALDAVEETVKVYQPISLDSLYDQFAKHFSQIQFEAIIALLLNEGRIYQDAQHRLRAGGRN